MTKRRKLILETVIFGFALLGVQLIDVSYRYAAIFSLGVFAYFFTAFSLKEDLKKISWLTNFPLPSLFTIAVGLFYFLLPESWPSRILIIGFYSIGIYAVLLSENIFVIAASRTIQLVRAAQAVNYLMTLITAFLLYDTVFSFRFNAITNALLIFIISLILILPSLWTVLLNEKLDKKIVNYSLILALITGQLAFFISFWPLTITVVSLFLTSALYILLGISQNHFSGKLFEDTFKEYLRVGLVILIIIFFLARWG